MPDELALPQGANVERLLQELYPSMEDWILDDIIQWIQNLWSYIGNAFSSLYGYISSWFYWLRDAIVSQIPQAINNWWYGVQYTFYWIRDKVLEIWNKLYAIASEVYAQVSVAIQSVVYQVVSSVSSFVNQMLTNLSSWFNQVWQWLSVHASNLAQTISSWFTETWDRISTFFQPWWERIAEWFNSVITRITELPGLIQEWFKATWENIKNLPGTILGAVIDAFGKLWDKVKEWLEKDIEEADKEVKQWEETGEISEGSPFWAVLIRLLLRGLSFLGKQFLKKLPQIALAAGVLGLEGVGALDKLVDEYVTPHFLGMMEHFESLGPMAPQPGGNIAGPITKTISAVISGLATFMLAGEAIGFFKHVGFGYLSAILYDLVNFRTLTGAFMTTLAAVYITQPIKYYYQSIARPYLPDLGTALNLAGEYALVPQAKVRGAAIEIAQLPGIDSDNRELFKEITKFHGYSDEWGDKLYELADTPARYFALRAMADSGFWDQAYYIRELMNSGYNIETIKNMLDMLRRYSLGEVKGIMLPSAIKRFREGFTDEEQLKVELESLGLPEEKIPLFVFAAQLDYQTDYASDLLAAYRTQYRKGMIEEADFRFLLDNLGIRPERVEGYVLRENASKWKAPKVKPLPEPVPEYLTDEGGIKVNTAKEAFRRDVITAEGLLYELVKLQMEPSMAEAIVEYEIVRKTPKAPE